MNSKLSPSKSPLSDILIDGITKSAMNAIVMNGASIWHPSDDAIL